MLASLWSKKHWKSSDSNSKALAQPVHLMGAAFSVLLTLLIMQKCSRHTFARQAFKRISNHSGTSLSESISTVGMRATWSSNGNLAAAGLNTRSFSSFLNPH